MRCAPARSGWRAAAALQDYGRLVKTEFLLRYLTRPPERRVIHRQLNKHESITALEDAVFYGNEGHIRLQTLDRQSTQAAALGLVSTAIVTWNTHHMNQIIEGCSGSMWLAAAEVDVGVQRRGEACEIDVVVNAPPAGRSTPRHLTPGRDSLAAYQ